MNLARVEHYLADYLSALELALVDVDGRPVGHPMQLHSAMEIYRTRRRRGSRSRPA